MEERSCAGRCLIRRGPRGPRKRRSPGNSGAVPPRTQPPTEPSVENAERGVRARGGRGPRGWLAALRPEKALGRSQLGPGGGEAAARPEGPPGAGKAVRRGAAGAPGSRGAGERSAGKSAPSGLLETRRIRFQINEIWVHTFTLLLPALMLF